MGKHRIVIFGAGGTGKAVFNRLKADPSTTVVSFVDSSKRGELFGLPVCAPEALLTLEYDFIYVATVSYSEVVSQIRSLGIDEGKIIKSEYAFRESARNSFLSNLSKELYRKNIPGNVAEAGVFRGEFAKLMNEHFLDRKLYLFDTFQGFDSRDIAYEPEYSADLTKGNYFKETSIDLVMSKMPHPENVVICQGYVPDSFAGIEDRFCFVNLDMDLYKPTLEALRWFYPRMNPGGGILIHDYFDTYTFPNLKRAVIEFVEQVGAQSFPIGDELSIFVIKGSKN